MESAKGNKQPFRSSSGRRKKEEGRSQEGKEAAALRMSGARKLF